MRANFLLVQLVFTLALTVNLVYQKELTLISELETQLILSKPDALPQTFVLLLCYQKDIKCADADTEIMTALAELKSQQYSFDDIINSDFVFRRVECITDYQRKLCTILGHGHYLKPARIQIIPSGKIVENTPKGVNQVFIDEKQSSSMVVYKFTSPILREYIKKKIMMFTVPTPVIPFDQGFEKIQELDDVRMQKNVIFALNSTDSIIIKQFNEIAAQYKERFFFILINNTNETSPMKSTLHSIGYNFSKSTELNYNVKNPALSKKKIEQSVQEWQFQDLLIWDMQKHIKNETYLSTLEGKLIVVGLAGKITNFLTTDFLFDFRKLAQSYRYSLNKYEFVVIDIDEEPTFRYLTTYNLGRFDSPGIFIIKDIHNKEYYRNYEIYDGTKNFQNISEGLIAAVNRKEKSPLYAEWIDSYQNLFNLEHWNNNRLKAYMYFLGVLSILVLPIALVIDCFFPLFGRGPHARGKSHDKKEQAEKKHTDADKPSNQNEEIKKQNVKPKRE